MNCSVFQEHPTTTVRFIHVTSGNVRYKIRRRRLRPYNMLEFPIVRGVFAAVAQTVLPFRYLVGKIA